MARLDPKAFEQCAGFLRIPRGDDPAEVRRWPAARTATSAADTATGAVTAARAVARVVRGADRSSGRGVATAPHRWPTARWRTRCAGPAWPERTAARTPPQVGPRRRTPGLSSG